MSFPPPPDQVERDKAVDISQSFIVKAPAGSGKTTLLVERFLRLLSVVNTPEQVLAITFTRKATAEMRNRIIERLQQAQGDNSSTDETALRVLARNTEHEWNLLDQPKRLNVITIDGLASFITHALPLSSSEEGLATTIGDDPSAWYFRAAERAIDGALNDASSREDAEVIVDLLNFRQSLLAEHLADMLGKRAVWQRFLFEYDDDEFVSQVVKSWADLAQEWRTRLYPILQRIELPFAGEPPKPLTSVLPRLARLMRQNLIESYGENHKLAKALSPFEGVDRLELHSDGDEWEALRFIVLADSTDSWRKRFTKPEGIGDKTTREQALAIIDALAQEVSDDDVRRIAILPSGRFTKLERRRIAALRTLLKRGLGELKLLFAEYGVSDFDAVTDAACNALGEDGKPSELALALDYKIQHLLIDEFQDTSRAQIDLIERLITGWQQGDGRTVFIVGDPMQSVYRFRGAEVANFNRVWHKGIGDIAITPISIHSNFRSRPELVEWVNKAFASIFALHPTDSAPFEQAMSARDCSQDGNTKAFVGFYALENVEREAEQVVNLIKKIRSEQPEFTIAILGNTRSAIHPSVQALRDNGIGVTGLKLESLWQQSVVRDLWIVTRAINDPTDSIAWASLFRAPWFNIELSELHQIMRRESVFTASVLLQIANDQVVDPSSQTTLQRIAQILKDRGAKRLDSLALLVWQALGGNTFYQRERAFAQAFFEQLRGVIDGQIAGLSNLEERLKASFVDTISSESNAVIATTIHQAKGLEYDVVIMPSMAKRPMSNTGDLLAVGVRNEFGKESLLFSERPDTNALRSRRKDVLKYFESVLESQERYRRLYVAATRAKFQTHMLWVRTGNKDFVASTATLLGPISEAVVTDSMGLSVIQTSDSVAAEPIDKVELNSIAKRRVLVRTTESEPKARPIQGKGAGFKALNWEREKSTFFGSAMHAWLEAIATVGFHQWYSLSDEEQRRKAQFYLARDGVAYLYDEVKKALAEKIEQSADAAWVLSSYDNAHCEWELQNYQDGSFKKHIIDRTFIKDGVRYVIDYKAGADYEAPKRDYIDQLNRYYLLLKEMEEYPIQLALYYPLHDRLWQWQGGNEPDFAITEESSTIGFD